MIRLSIVKKPEWRVFLWKLVFKIGAQRHVEMFAFDLSGTTKDAICIGSMRKNVSVH